MLSPKLTRCWVVVATSGCACSRDDVDVPSATDIVLMPSDSDWLDATLPRGCNLTAWLDVAFELLDELGSATWASMDVDEGPAPEKSRG